MSEDHQLSQKKSPDKDEALSGKEKRIFDNPVLLFHDYYSSYMVMGRLLQDCRRRQKSKIRSRSSDSLSSFSTDVSSTTRLSSSPGKAESPPKCSASLAANSERRSSSPEKIESLPESTASLAITDKPGFESSSPQKTESLSEYIINSIVMGNESEKLTSPEKDQSPKSTLSLTKIEKHGDSISDIVKVSKTAPRSILKSQSSTKIRKPSGEVAGEDKPGVVEALSYKPIKDSDMENPIVLQSLSSETKDDNLYVNVETMIKDADESGMKSIGGHCSPNTSGPIQEACDLNEVYNVEIEDAFRHILEEFQNDSNVNKVRKLFHASILMHGLNDLYEESKKRTKLDIKDFLCSKERYDPSESGSDDTPKLSKSPTGTNKSILWSLGEPRGSIGDRSSITATTDEDVELEEIPCEKVAELCDALFYSTAKYLSHLNMELLILKNHYIGKNSCSKLVTQDENVKQSSKIPSLKELIKVYNLHIGSENLSLSTVSEKLDASTECVSKGFETLEDTSQETESAVIPVKLVENVSSPGKKPKEKKRKRHNSSPQRHFGQIKAGVSGAISSMRTGFRRATSMTQHSTTRYSDNANLNLPEDSKEASIMMIRQIATEILGGMGIGDKKIRGGVLVALSSTVLFESLILTDAELNESNKEKGQENLAFENEAISLVNFKKRTRDEFEDVEEFKECSDLEKQGSPTRTISPTKESSPSKLKHFSPTKAKSPSPTKARLASIKNFLTQCPSPTKKCKKLEIFLENVTVEILIPYVKKLFKLLEEIYLEYKLRQIKYPNSASNFFPNEQQFEDLLHTLEKEKSDKQSSNSPQSPKKLWGNKICKFHVDYVIANIESLVINALRSKHEYRVCVNEALEKIGL